VNCKIIFVFLLVSNFSYSVDITVKAERYDKLKLKLIIIGRQSKRLECVAGIIKKDLEFSGQFEVILEHKKSGISTKSDITNYFNTDCRLGIFLLEHKRKSFDWRLYDLEYAAMLKGEKYKTKGKELRGWAHNIADSIWPNLTGESGFFSTKIVYCKKLERGKKTSYQHVYVADYDGSHEKLLVSTPTVNIAPRWNNDKKRPLVFYSEHTNKNVRLMVVDMHGRKKVASNFDGLNVLPSFSPDGRKFAYCASRGGGFSQIYYFDGELKKLTSVGTNISPTFADNGSSLYFCSDADSKKCTQIYKYDLRKKGEPSYKSERILKSGFQVSTVFSVSKNLLAYAKTVAGVMQIFVYNPSEKTHKQLTFGRGNKEECSWSPCGNYLLFSVEKDCHSRLAIMNLLTGKMDFVTGADSRCCYPSWSPIYAQFPCV